MWLKLSASKLNFNLKLDNYDEDNENDYLDTSFELLLSNVINYKRNNKKIFTNDNIIELRDLLANMINHEDDIDDDMLSFEPDFIFEYIDDYSMDVTIYFWTNEEHDYNTTNSLKITLNEDNINYLYNYLRLITDEISIDDSVITDMINNNILVK